MAWTEVQKNDYVSATTAAPITMANTPIFSDVINTDMGSQSAAIVGIIVVSAGTEAVSTLDLHTSYDGVTFFKAGNTVIADLVTGSTGTTQVHVDLSLINAPFYKLVFNANSATVGTTGTF
jgi:hypothetical protein